MKKALWLTAICAVLVFATASLAFAATGSDYAPWSATGANAAVPSPHNGYSLTTVKCAVCHAVHQAPASGEILLRDVATNACVYCHITTTVGNVRVYNGDQTWYTAVNQHNHSGSEGAACNQCHAVHGAGAINTAIDGGSIAARILKQSPGGNTPQAGTPWDYASADRRGVISKFCTGCHPYYVGAYNGDHAGSYGVGTFGGHIMSNTINNYTNPAKGTGVPTQVAWAGSLYCTSCHDAGNVKQGTGTWPDNFPHYTTALRFEKAATSSVAPSSYDATTSAVQDGVCLKCHTNGTAGVNMNF
jgi:predicted CXXCH cytochrome family protein